MPLLQIIMIGVGLSMDAFAVALCKGACMRKANIYQCLLIAAFFGVFQGLMPSIGWMIGIKFRYYIEAFDHWIAFILLSLIGVSMIREGFVNHQEEEYCTVLTLQELLVLAIATSIDALATGIVFAIEKVNIILPALWIAGITFSLSLLGTLIGKRAGEKLQNKAQFTGGTVLILIGVKILLEHLHVLP